MNRLIIGLVGCLALYIQPGVAQGLRLLGQIGRSSYGSMAIGGLGTGGGSDQEWKVGTIVGLGVRFQTSHNPTFDGIIEYSIHSFQSVSGGAEPTNDPKNKIVEFAILARFNIDIAGPVRLSLFPGISPYYQLKDDRVYSNPAYNSKGESRFGVGGVVGAGFSVECSSVVDLYLDGSLRMRSYITPVIELGIALRID